METGHPSTRAVNSGSGNRALVLHISSRSSMLHYVYVRLLCLVLMAWRPSTLTQTVYMFHRCPLKVYSASLKHFSFQLSPRVFSTLEIFLSMCCRNQCFIYLLTYLLILLTYMCWNSVTYYWCWMLQCPCCCAQLSQNAVADYNRARLYLADLANRDGVPVLSDISEAVNCAVQRLREFASDWTFVSVVVSQRRLDVEINCTIHHTTQVTSRLGHFIFRLNLSFKLKF